MNNIDFLKYPKFPLSSDSLSFMQQMVVLTAKLASLGGNNYILSGCVETGSNVSSGVIVIAGEILSFQAGTKETYIVIEETKRTVTAEGQVFADIYITRKARFGTGSGQIAWATITRAPALVDVANNLNELADAFTEHTDDHRVAWDHVDDKPAFAEQRILKTGRFYIGDAYGDNRFVIEFDTIGTVEYIVTGSLRVGSGVWHESHRVIWVVGEQTENSFCLYLHEFDLNIQHLWFDFALIKAPL